MAGLFWFSQLTTAHTYNI